MLNIPEEKLPPEFKETERLNSLYSPFRSAAVNPKDFDSKLASWRSLLFIYCTNNTLYQFTLPQINKLLMLNGRAPSCLATVLQQLIDKGELQYLDDFMKEKSKSWRAWATDLLIKRPLQWTLKAVTNSLLQNKSNEVVFVHTAVIKEEAKRVLTIFQNSKVNFVTFSMFSELIGKTSTQMDDVKLLIQYLAKENLVDIITINVVNNQELLLIKVGINEQITEADVALYSLEQNENFLTKQVEDFEDEIAACIKEAKKQISIEHRQLAKSWLRKKQEIEKRLLKKTNALNNIHVLISRIKDLHGDVAVWQSYKKAIHTFNETIVETGLSEDAVENTMIELGEVLENQEDIQTAMSVPVIQDDDEYLEKELLELLDNEQTEKGMHSPLIDNELNGQLAKLNISNLPNVPNVEVSQPEAL